MHEFNIKTRVQLSPVTRKNFADTMERHQKAGRLLERLPAPSPEHKCAYCPIDPHTMRYVLVMLAKMRDAYLSKGMNMPMENAAEGLYIFTHVNALDTTMAALCGEFAPEIGREMLENYK